MLRSARRKGRDDVAIGAGHWTTSQSPVSIDGEARLPRCTYDRHSYGKKGEMPIHLHVHSQENGFTGLPPALSFL